MFRTVALFALAAVAFAADDVDIKVISKPDECTKLTKAGDQLGMHYTGTIAKSSEKGTPGKQFDSSVGRGKPFDFTLGQGQVIKGWDQGLLGMCVGEKRELTIPPSLGYGDAGAGGDIPAGATLHFSVECVSIGEGAPQPNIFADIDKNKDGALTKDELQDWFKSNHQRDVPPELMKTEDKDEDGKVSWAEFSGPKGDAPPGGDKEADKEL